MKLAIVLMIIILAACSCSLSQFSFWGERGSTASLIEEQADERSLQEFAELEAERRGAEVVEERVKAGLPKEVKCPRCYHAVSLPAEARKGDQLRCGSCGKTFAFDPNSRSEAGGKQPGPHPKQDYCLRLNRADEICSICRSGCGERGTS